MMFNVGDRVKLAKKYGNNVIETYGEGTIVSEPFNDNGYGTKYRVCFENHDCGGFKARVTGNFGHHDLTLVTKLDLIIVDDPRYKDLFE